MRGGEGGDKRAAGGQKEEREEEGERETHFDSSVEWGGWGFTFGNVELRERFGTQK